MADKVEALLDQIHNALLQGQFLKLAAFSEELEQTAMLLSLRDTPITHEIRRKAARNELCLQAALRGMQSARMRVKEIAKAVQGLTTYSATGHLSVLGGKTKPGKRF